MIRDKEKESAAISVRRWLSFSSNLVFLLSLSLYEHNCEINLRNVN